MKPWRQARPHWDFAAELLLKATETGAKDAQENLTGLDAFACSCFQARARELRNEPMELKMARFDALNFRNLCFCRWQRSLWAGLSILR
jgi:hypothetical protein